MTNTFGFLSFVGGKDNLDNNLVRFEIYVPILGWYTWAIRLSPLLTGKALDVYSDLTYENARDYEKLRKALLQRCNFTEQRYRERFRNA